jgi:aspartyl-tRNA(Asn)/glutamyl-tRNA(Gln) amidotransferase subunit A
MHGESLDPLHGVPFAVDDPVNTAGGRTTFGSVARLKAAGAILVGKTTTPEFGRKAACPWADRREMPRT